VETEGQEWRTVSREGQYNEVEKCRCDRLSVYGVKGMMMQGPGRVGSVKCLGSV
jgi:hypothetical protein